MRHGQGDYSSRVITTSATPATPATSATSATPVIRATGLGLALSHLTHQSLALGLDLPNQLEQTYVHVQLPIEHTQFQLSLPQSSESLDKPTHLLLLVNELH
jgi:hypothetical protein